LYFFFAFKELLATAQEKKSDSNEEENFIQAYASFMEKNQTSVDNQINGNIANTVIKFNFSEVILME